MGLNVSENRFVQFDDTHQKRVDTSFDGNPTVTMVEGLKVRHVFRRNRTGDRDRDGNPLIHALKGLNGYGMVPMYRTMFMNRARDILTTFIEDLDAQAVVPVPSSNGFCADFATVVATMAGVPVIMPDFLSKRTVARMVELYDGSVPAGLNRRQAHAFKSQLATWRRLHGGQLVSMKEVDTHIRTYFDPLELTGATDHIAGVRVIVVDDLMSSGSSIAAMTGQLTRAGAEVTGAVTFLSGL